MSQEAGVDSTTSAAAPMSGVQITDFEAGLDALTKAHMIKEEYRTWKKNAPLLYDTIINNTLEQVSLTVEWFSDMQINHEKQYISHRLLTGTQIANNIDGEANNNAVIISEVRLPTLTKSNQDGNFTKKLTNTGRVETIQRIVHDGDVNRARYMPQNPNIIATKSSNKDVYIFDRTQHPLKPTKGAECTPQLRLVGHTQEGYGLAWSPLSNGKVFSGSGDKKILLWDIAQSGVNTKPTDVDGKIVSAGDAVVNDATNPTATSNKNALQPIQTFSAHTDIVEDVCSHSINPHMLISCGDDKLICVWDTRTGGEPTFKVKAHSAEVNSISTNPFDENIFVSGSSDKTVGLWDLRNLTQKLHSFEHHTDQVFSVQWSPFSSSIFASSGCDRRVLIWDIERIGEEQDAEDAEDGPPELFFQHAGHTDKVNDIAWSAAKDWLIASTADDDILQVWECAKAIRDEVQEDDDEEIADDDLE